MPNLTPEEDARLRAAQLERRNRTIKRQIIARQRASLIAKAQEAVAAVERREAIAEKYK